MIDEDQIHLNARVDRESVLDLSVWGGLTPPPSGASQPPSLYWPPKK